MGSNPGTPVSGPPLSSPVLGKNSPSGGSQAQHGMQQQDQFGNRMHFKSNCSKEANLMPVPSPQQIQFPLLDGQELTIQKQPNTSLRDSDLVSPSVGGDPSTPQPADPARASSPGPHTPSSQLGDSAPPKYPGPSLTPSGGGDGNMYMGDPGTPSSQDKGRSFPGGVSPSNLGGMPPQDINMPLNPGTPSTQSQGQGPPPSKTFDPISSMAQMSQQLTGQVTTPCSTPNSVGQGPDSGLGSMGNLEHGMMNSPLGGAMLGPDGNPVCTGSGMLPGLDSSPTTMDSMGPNGPMMGPGGNRAMRPNGPMMGPNGPMMGPNGPMGGPGGPGMMGPGGPNMMGPTSGPMMGPGPMGPTSSGSSSPGGTFATVKASAPNTIQYLPSRPPNSQAGPRGSP